MQCLVRGGLCSAWSSWLVMGLLRELRLLCRQLTLWKHASGVLLLRHNAVASTAKHMEWITYGVQHCRTACLAQATCSHMLHILVPVCCRH